MKKSENIFNIYCYFIIYNCNFFNFKSRYLSIKKILKVYKSQIICFFQLIGDIERSTKKLNNDYNVNFLPKTQFLDLTLEKLSFQFLRYNEAGYAQNIKQKVRQSFYLDYHNGKVFFLTSQGQLLF